MYEIQPLEFTRLPNAMSYKQTWNHHGDVYPNFYLMSEIKPLR